MAREPVFGVRLLRSAEDREGYLTNKRLASRILTNQRLAFRLLTNQRLVLRLLTNQRLL